MALGQEANSDNQGNLFDLLNNYCMLSLIRIASTRRF